jgi:uncharacterized membrane protein YeaQ/YmgE (transglycosylase-associated protein family)
MVVVGGIVGALVGFTLGVIFTEVIFANDQEWPSVFNVALTVVGALAGSSLMRRLTHRDAKPT